MVIIVPAVADADNRHQPIVHAVVFDIEVFVAPLRHMADDVQDQGGVQSHQTCQHTGSCDYRSESCPENDAEKQAAEDVHSIAELPVRAGFQKSVERVSEEVFALNARIDVLGIVPLAIERV